MSFAGGSPGLNAVQALIDAQGTFPAIADKDWATAAALIVKKLLTSAGQTAESLIALRTAVGASIFDTQLKTLSHHQAKQLARRLDKAVPDLEVSTARAAIAHILTLLVPALPEPAAIDPVTDHITAEPEAVAEPAPEPETAAADTTGDGDTPPSPPAAPNPYFGRKSFRTG
jgi:hypothetical protein